MDTCLYECENLCISRHAYDRLKERNGWNKKAANRMLYRIYEDGIRPENVKGYLKGWVNRKAEMYNDGREFVLFGEKLYVFCEGMMLTVIPVPTRSYLIRVAV